MTFTFKISSEFEETLDNVISSLLPHQNFDVGEASAVVEELFRTIPLAETSGVYYVFMKLLQRLSVVKMYIANATTVLRREVFEHAIMSGASEVVLQAEFDAVQFFGAYGKTYNLEVPAQFSEATSFVYSVCMEKYDELFAKAISSAEGMTWINILKQQLEYAVTAKMLSVAATTLVEGRATDKAVKRGPAEARDFLMSALTEVNARINMLSSDSNNRKTETAITSFSASRMFDDKNRIKVKDLYYMGIDPIDDVLPIRTQDIVTIIADEGIGKTRLMIDQTYKALLAGNNVLYICGETAKFKIKKSIEATHCFKMYGLQLKWSEVDDPGTIQGLSVDELEDISIKINSALADLYENESYGTLVLVQSADYESFSDTVRMNKDKYNIDLVIVDHVLALGCTGAFTTSGRLTTDHLRVNYLYECEDILVKDCNVAFINTSHPSSATSAALKAGQAPGARAGAESASSTRYSSIVCVLTTKPELKKQDIVLLYVTKLRDEPNTSDACVLKRLGYSNVHVFDPAMQYMGGSDKQSSFDDISALYLDKEEEN